MFFFMARFLRKQGNLYFQKFDPRPSFSESKQLFALLLPKMQ